MRRRPTQISNKPQESPVPLQVELDTSVPVVTLKIGRYVVHHGTLGIARSLGQQGVPVYAMVEDRFSPVAMSRYLAGALICDTRGGNTERLITLLTSIREQLSRVAILVPTDDAAAIFIAEHAEVLEKFYLFPSIPKELARRLTNKKDLYSLCRSIGVPCPEAVFPESINDVIEFMECATFPVVVKAADSRRLPQNVRPTSIIGTPSELLALYNRAENLKSPNLIFQEYIPQSCAEDWIFHGYRNPRTDCSVAFTGKKLRSFPPFAGMTTLGIPVANEPLRRQTEKLLRAINYSGVIDLDYRLDKRDGQYKLLDFNPRIGANFRMFEDCAGVDVVRALHLDLTGRKVFQLPAIEGRTFIVESYDPFASLSYIRQNRLSVREWWESLKGRREFAWLSLADLNPFLMMWIRLLMQTIGGKLRKSWTYARQHNSLTRRNIANMGTLVSAHSKSRRRF
jgi:D-aspartate ligase